MCIIEVRGDRCQTALYDVITRVHNGWFMLGDIYNMCVHKTRRLDDFLACRLHRYYNIIITRVLDILCARMCVCVLGNSYILYGYNNNIIICRFLRDIFDHATDFVWNGYPVMFRDVYKIYACSLRRRCQQRFTPQDTDRVAVESIIIICIIL